MPTDHTQIQGDDEYRQARQLSLERTRPPTEVHGYEMQRFLGAGAFGEVWVAVNRNTGRRVAIKFYAHCGGLDWSLLSREVEKLVLLSADRYVVQLLDVGWDTTPPYYVMEYMEHGSLDDRLRTEHKLSVHEAVRLFREVAMGLAHAHGRGILHCDLKPANVLLDQDSEPRLADFGQSRMSSDQDPALGTLFYMAPEQANLQAVADVRWDVYALGSLLYAMLTGAPPHRTDEALLTMETAADLDERLSRYRRLLLSSPPPIDHRRVPGVDRGLADIIERCLAANPEQRFPNVQAVLAALDAREARRTRRPLILLGMFGPLLLVLVMGLTAWRGLNTAVGESEEALTDRALESNAFAARAQAEAVGGELERRFRVLEEVANNPDFQAALEKVLDTAELVQLREHLNDATLDEGTLAPLRKKFTGHQARRDLQQELEKLIGEEDQPEVASWIVNDPQGLQLERYPTSPTIGVNFAWRSYFHGELEDKPLNWRPSEADHVQHTSLSTIFRSQATGRWIAAVSTPVYKDGAGGRFLGVVTLTVEVGRFVKLQGGQGQLAVLVDWRDGESRGVILQHPLFEQLLASEGRLPDRMKNHHLVEEGLPTGERENRASYYDPVGEDEQGADYHGRWLAEMVPVTVHGKDSGLLVIVQETYDHAIGPALRRLQQSLLWIGLVAMGVVVGVLTLLWTLVIRGLADMSAGTTARLKPNGPTVAAGLTTVSDRSTH